MAYMGWHLVVIICRACQTCPAGVNWRDPQYWDCNGQAEPTFMHSYDGEHLNPLEVMFVPVDRQRLYGGHPTARLAKRYDRWQQELVSLVPVFAFMS